ncbi:MAG: GntR family transcriptional regulator [Pseudomonas veronii]|jgi:DNA-binding GntR family transcriptional regulator|uniref:GntR family transcriptional regulator n=1 Tax=Pseudomonas veronii TaxID=76761 RepID=A0A7Y1ABF6_PSEVE|nr:MULTISPECIES: GntR family transcriptional regulator [Pseudomonas]KAA0945509.1 GntR family transcriptional regulator [Pseudomonas sp. ANT_H14]KAA0946355.1 GntR family transcriptional regulator [Pseudomonas sp. ANT_H4]NMY12537.1 GntR family transcriptional regulator [Pseudomonas veronii]
MCEVLLKALGPRPDRQVDFFYIAAQLAQGINDGTLPIGTKLSQQAIADHYEISRMPVREALRCLQARGLIDGKPHHTPQVVGCAANEDSVLAKAQAELSKALRLLEKCLPRLDRPNDELAPVVAEFISTCQTSQGGDQ